MNAAANQDENTKDRRMRKDMQNKEGREMENGFSSLKTFLA
jgi:hypothetical protein